MSTLTYPDMRERFFIKNSPVRGDVLRLSTSYAKIIAQKDYPLALQKLLGEMLVAAGLLIGTLKIEGRLSLQLQHNGVDNASETRLKWAMAECDDKGNLRGLADWQGDWSGLCSADDAFKTLGKTGEGVLFIHIQPTDSLMGGEGYQGIVERVADNLADCLAHYQKQSVQIPTLINLACDGLQAGGMLLQLLPPTTAEERDALDNDLFPRLGVLAKTLKSQELTTLSTNEILFRLYHEEDVVTDVPMPLQFSCTCSAEKSAGAIFQLGKVQALEISHEQGGAIALDCGFCGQVYRYDMADIEQIFG